MCQRWVRCKKDEVSVELFSDREPMTDSGAAPVRFFLNTFERLCVFQGSLRYGLSKSATFTTARSLHGIAPHFLDEGCPP